MTVVLPGTRAWGGSPKAASCLAVSVPTRPPWTGVESRCLVSADWWSGQAFLAVQALPDLGEGRVRARGSWLWLCYVGSLVATWPGPRTLALRRDVLQSHSPPHHGFVSGGPAEIGVWAAGGGSDELVLAPGWPQESQLQEVTRVSVAQPCLSRPEAHVQPCPLLLALRGRLLQPLTWPVIGRPACERCAWCRWAGRYPSPSSAALQPWLWPLSCPPGLLGPTPPQRPCHGKACHGRRQEVTGGGQTKGGQIKAGGLSTGWPGTRDRGLTRPRSQQEGFSPSW